MDLKIGYEENKISGTRTPIEFECGRELYKKMLLMNDLSLLDIEALEQGHVAITENNMIIECYDDGLYIFGNKCQMCSCKNRCNEYLILKLRGEL